MSWNIKAGLRQKLKAEEGTIIKDWGGKTSYLLVYPNTYFIGMSNLGIHNIYRLLNSRRDIVCERAFLPEKGELAGYKRTKTPILSVETQRPMTDFDKVIFSAAFENDLPNIREMLSLSGIPLLKGGRGASYPELIAGGVVVTLNQGLFKNIFDDVVTGDFELSHLFRTRGTEDVIHRSSGDPSPNTQGIECSAPDDVVLAHNVIWTPDTEFGSMHLVEVQRGCPHRCGFCSAPVVYHPFRQFSKEEIISAVDFGLSHRRKIGLIGGDIFAHPAFEEIADYIHSKGAVFSPSSVRADRVTPIAAELLAASGHKTVTLAPETGSEDLRRRIGKKIPDEKFFSAARILVSHGVNQFKLYFMIGLPGETDEDIEAIAGFVRRFKTEAVSKGGGRTSKITAAVNQFVPKPKTPFQNEIFLETTAAKKRMAVLKRLLGRIGGVSVKMESPLSSLREYRARS